MLAGKLVEDLLFAINQLSKNSSVQLYMRHTHTHTWTVALIKSGRRVLGTK